MNKVFKSKAERDLESKEDLVRTLEEELNQVRLTRKELLLER